MNAGVDIRRFERTGGGTYWEKMSSIDQGDLCKHCRHLHGTCHYRDCHAGAELAHRVGGPITRCEGFAPA